MVRLIITSKGGEGSGWFSPPRGTHTGESTEYDPRTGTSNGMRVKIPAALTKVTDRSEYYKLKFQKPVQMLYGWMGSWSAMRIGTLETQTPDSLAKLEGILKGGKFTMPYKAYEIMDGNEMEL